MSKGVCCTLVAPIPDIIVKKKFTMKTKIACYIKSFFNYCNLTYFMKEMYLHFTNRFCETF